MATHRIMRTYQVSFEVEGFTDQTFSRVVLAKSKKGARQKFLAKEKKAKAVTAIKELK